jgi:hypothetical protein
MHGNTHTTQEVMAPVGTESNQNPAQSVDAISTENKPADLTSRDRSSLLIDRRSRDALGKQ